MTTKNTTGRGRGRPAIAEADRRIQVSISLRQGDVARLRKFARASGIPFSSLFQDMVSGFLSRRGL